jgi:trehalose synthase
LSESASIIVPAIDPLAHKNRELHPVKLAGVLTNAGLLRSEQPVLTEPFRKLVSRLGPNGRFRSLDDGAQEVGLMFRPTVTQVSRWDRLKGWESLLKGFVRLKQELKTKMPRLDARNRRRLELVRLILAGPEPESVKDDPEAQEVLDELIEQYQRLNPTLQRDIAVLSLPMHSIKENALIVNALQRCSSVVAQNSLQEGFGLVVTEAMWKRTPVLGSSAHGIRQQIRDGLDGVLVSDPTDPDAVKTGLFSILNDPNQRATSAQSAQRRVYDEFLIFRQLSS